MKVRELSSLPEVLLIELDPFEDHRGFFVELYNKDLYEKSGISVNFVEDDVSVSTKHVLRGIHGDFKTWKLITCLTGKIYVVVVDCRTDSERFGRWQSLVLSEHNRLQLLIPPGYGLAHLVLSEVAILHYKQSEYYDPKGQFTYRWNDDRFKIWWPVEDPILSQRDEKGGCVSE